jgi:hypothetical protein
MTDTAIFTLNAWIMVDGAFRFKAFAPTRPGGISPEQKSAALIWLDARRREVPSDVSFEGGVDIFVGSEWIPYTNLNGADAWSKQIRTEARS